MMIITNLEGIKTYFNLYLLSWFYNTIWLLNLENSFFFYLFIIQTPCHILFLYICNSHSDKFRITSVRFGHNLSLKIYYWWLEDKLRFYCLTCHENTIINSYWVLYKHRNRYLIMAWLFWIKLQIKWVYFLWFKY